jgi:hydroxymethylbilane synthase
MELGIVTRAVPITTQGDVKTQPLGQIGGQGLFTKELQRALLDQQIDLAVHSLKDLPTAPMEGLVLAAVPERESTSDVLVSSIARRIEDLPVAARVGTGSLRRRAQLLHLRPDLKVETFGNMTLACTRRRLRRAIILAELDWATGLTERIVTSFHDRRCSLQSAKGPGIEA